MVRQVAALVVVVVVVLAVLLLLLLPWMHTATLTAARVAKAHGTVG